jgi:hypothetical protein
VRRHAAAVLGAVAIVAAMAGPARGQEGPPVQLFLVEQTTFASPDSPFEIRVAARNETEAALGNLSLTVAVHSTVSSRSEYAQALEAGALSALVARTEPVRGRIGPGATRRLPEMTLRLPDLTAIGVNALYPVTVELRSGVVLVASLRTMLVFIEEEPLTPLLVSTSLVLDAPVRVRADGTLVDDALVSQILPGGRLDSIVSGLEAVPRVAVTLVVSPVLLEQLQSMRDGYRVADAEGVQEVPPDGPGARAAGGLVDRIRELARQPSVEIVALPYASPSVPALVHAGLDDDLNRQIDRGHVATAALLGKDPTRAVFHPPGSAVTSSSFAPLATALEIPEGDTPALLLDGDVARPPPPNPLTPPVTVEVVEDGTPLLAVASDPGVEDRAASLPDDPILRAQWTLGELSAIYFEQPGTSRGTALIIGEQDDPEAAFISTLLRGIGGKPGVSWLRGVSASRLVESDLAVGRRRLVETVRPSPLAGSFSTEMERSRDDVAALASMAEQPQLVAQLDRLLLLSESRYLGGDEDLRFEYLDAARATVDAEFDKVRLPPPSSITLTAQTGRIPVTLRSDTGYPVQLRLSLRASGLDLIGGPTRDITLARPIQTFVFPARSQRTGRFPATLTLDTPDGRTIGSTEIVVRSTAYNRVALVITIGAALFLALWWGRRFLSRTKT